MVLQLQGHEPSGLQMRYAVPGTYHSACSVDMQKTIGANLNERMTQYHESLRIVEPVKNGKRWENVASAGSGWNSLAVCCPLVQGGI